LHHLWKHFLKVLSVTTDSFNKVIKNVNYKEIMAHAP
jgi:hypothetical protein